MFTFGSDPEFMLTKGGKYYSAIGIIKGDIGNRISQNGHQFYWDNVLAECAIKPGASREAVVANFRECFKLYAELVDPYELVAQASQDYPDSEMLVRPFNAKEKKLESREAGCAPDLCAYTLKKKKPPKSIIKNTNLRTGGGHVHLGATEGILPEESYEQLFIVYLLDLFIGIPSLFIDHDPTSARRREVYGQAGRYRVKDYGLEYRSLSNFWLASPKLVEFVYDVSKFTVEFVESGRWKELWTFDEDIYFTAMTPAKMSKAYQATAYDKKMLMDCLSTNNLTLAKQYLELAQKYLPKKLNATFEKLTQPTTYNFYEEWRIRD